MYNILILVTENKALHAEYFIPDFMIDHFDCYDYAYAFRAAGYKVFFADWRDWNGSVFSRMWDENAKTFVTPVVIDAMDIIWVYKTKDYFFNPSKLTQMLTAFARTSAFIVNDPKTILHNINKEYLFELEKQNIAIVPTYHICDELIKTLISANKTITLKPKYGAFSHNIYLVPTLEKYNTLNINKDDFLMQEYQPCISRGEISLVFLGLEYQHAFIRTPAENNFLCSVHFGARATIYFPTKAEINFAINVLDAYAALGFSLYISRVDLFRTDRGLMLSEAEVFNPTLCSKYSHKLSFSKKIVRYLSKYSCRC